MPLLGRMPQRPRKYQPSVGFQIHDTKDLLYFKFWES